MKQLGAMVVTLLLMSGAMLVVVMVTSPCRAENVALKSECEAKAEKASELITTLGAEAAYRQIEDPEGPFVGSNSHLFCIDTDTGTLLAHKVTRFVGANMHNYLDADGKTVYAEILEKAKPAQKGWVTYMSHGSGPERRATPGLKHMHFYKVPGKNIVLCCGYWDTL